MDQMIYVVLVAVLACNVVSIAMAWREYKRRMTALQQPRSLMSAVSLLQLKPGDRVYINIPERLGREERDRLRAEFKAWLSGSRRLLTTTGYACTLQVIRQPADGADLLGSELQQHLEPVLPFSSEDQKQGEQKHQDAY